MASTGRERTLTLIKTVGAGPAADSKASAADPAASQCGPRWHLDSRPRTRQPPPRPRRRTDVPRRHRCGGNRPSRDPGIRSDGPQRSPSGRGRGGADRIAARGIDGVIEAGGPRDPGTLMGVVASRGRQTDPPARGWRLSTPCYPPSTERGSRAVTVAWLVRCQAGPDRGGWRAAPDREILWAHAIELPDPGPYLSGGELVMTTGITVGTDARTHADYVGDWVPPSRGARLRHRYQLRAGAAGGIIDAADQWAFRCCRFGVDAFIAITRTVIRPDQRRSGDSADRRRAGSDLPGDPAGRPAVVTAPRHWTRRWWHCRPQAGCSPAPDRIRTGPWRWART